MTDEPRKWLSFDPTIHAGHLLTAATIIACAVTSWFTMRADINALKTADTTHEIRMSQIEARAESERERTDRKFDALMKENAEAVNKLRDDMQNWFMTLNDKLDRKADKR